MIQYDKAAEEVVVWARQIYKSATEAVAKAEKIEEALTALALLFERELLLTAVNHEKNKEELKDQILKAQYGEYELLAKQITLARAENEQKAFEFRRKLNKSTPRYSEVSSPFRGAGSRVLQSPRNPRQNGNSTNWEVTRRPSSRVDEREMEALENAKGPKENSGMAGKGGAFAMDRATSKRVEMSTKPRSKGRTRDGKIDSRRGIYYWSSKSGEPNICYSEKDWRLAPHS